MGEIRSSAWLELLEAKFRQITNDSRLIEAWLKSASTGVERKGERYFQRARLLFPHLYRGRILDAGCGDGEIALRFALAGAKVVAVDADSEFIEVAKLHARDFPSIDIRFSCVDLCDPLTLTDMSFDLILSIDVIEHVQDAAAYLTNLQNMLNPGGKIWLFTPNRFAPSNVLSDPHYKLTGLTLLPSKWAELYAVRICKRTRVYEVTQLFTPRSLARLAESSGLVCSFQSTSKWNDVLARRPWLKGLSKLPVIERLLFWAYEYYIGTIEAILTIPSES